MHVVPNLYMYMSLCSRQCYKIFCCTQDPVYPIIFYECVLHCWKQEYTKRPSAEKVYTHLQNFRSTLVNKYSMEMYSSIPTVAVVIANGIQCLWAVTECNIRQLDDPSVRSKSELTIIQQTHPSGLEFLVRISPTWFSVISCVSSFSLLKSCHLILKAMYVFVSYTLQWWWVMVTS